MKGLSNRLRGIQLSIILLLMMCTTILFWAWEKNPRLTSLLPPQNPSLQLQLSTVKPVSSESQTYRFGDKRKFTKKDVVMHQEEQLLDQVAPLDSADNPPVMDVIITNSATRPFEKKDKAVGSPGKEATWKKTLKAANNWTTKIQSSNSEVERKYKQTFGKNTSEKEQSRNVRSKRASAKTISTRTRSEAINNTLMGNQASCNYAKGKWVVDNNRPLYSGFDCKQWLSGMWSCRLTQRTDFSYEKLRWQPKDCQMEEFEGSKFLARMQGKTLAFVGDSLGRQQFQSLMCMLTGGKNLHDVIDVGSEYGLAKPHGTKRPDGWAYRFTRTNATILYYWSACLCDLQPVDIRNPNTDHAMHLDRPPAFLRRYLHRISILVLNTGHHWNRGKFRANRWVMYVGGVPNKDKKLAPMGNAKNLTIHSTVKWVDSQLGKHPGLQVFYRSISPRHFVNGEWNTGGSCNNTTPMSIGKELLQEESSDQSAASAVKGTRVKLLDITGLSNMRDEGHMSRFSLKATPGVQDCLHWCLPGVPDTWNEILLAQI